MKEIGNDIRANILVDALPYIQRYSGKILVVKYGGNAMISKELRDAVMSDIVLLSLVGVKTVLVHGGGPEINETLAKMGIESKFINGLRYTDGVTAEVVQMVLSGKTNKNLVKLLEKRGGRALGLSGLDGGMVTAKKTEDADLGFVGDITKVNTKPIFDILDAGYIPVIASLGADKAGNTYNINADTFASKIASALKAESLILLTDTRGLLADKLDESTLITEVKTADIAGLKKSGIISGGMIPKIDCVADALAHGVERATIIDGRVPHSLLIELFSSEGIGTLFI